MPSALPALLLAAVASVPPIDEAQDVRLLKDLDASCRRMLTIQVSIYNSTRNANLAVPPQRSRNHMSQLKLGEDLVQELTCAVDLLNAKGAAVAFPEVFEQVRDDAKIVQARLAMGDFGPRTQALQRDCVETLQEMVQALRPRRR